MAGFEISWAHTNSSILAGSTASQFIDSWRQVAHACLRKYSLAWLQYGNFLDLLFLDPLARAGLKVVVTPHLAPMWRSRSNPILRRISDRLLRQAHAIVPLASALVSEFARIKGPSINVGPTFLPSAVLEKDYVDERLPAPLILAFAGRLLREKGIFEFVDACRILQTQKVQFEAHIAGSGDRRMENELSARIRDFGLERQVTFHGRLDDAALRLLLLRTHYLVHLSRVDAYPLIVLEALACGTTPICVDLPGTREIITKYGGFLVPDADSRAVAGHIVATRAEPPRAHADKVRVDHAWSTAAAEYQRIFERVLVG